MYVEVPFDDVTGFDDCCWGTLAVSDGASSGMVGLSLIKQCKGPLLIFGFLLNYAVGSILTDIA